MFNPGAKILKGTGKSLSEALLYAEHGEKMLFTKIVLNVRNNFCTQLVLPRVELGIFMYWSWCKNKSFWQRFTCTYQVDTGKYFLNGLVFKAQQVRKTDAKGVGLLIKA